MVESGVSTGEDLEKAKTESIGLGLFARSLLGMDRQAAKNAGIVSRRRKSAGERDPIP